MNRIAGEWGIWLPSSLIAGAVVFGVLTLFRTPSLLPSRSSDATARSSVSKVELASGANALLNDEVVLRDPTPLFLPSRWNAAEDALALNAPREPGGALQDYAAKLSFSADELKLELPPAVTVPSRPSDTFEIGGSDRSAAGFGQADTVVPPLPARGGFIEVVSASSGEVELRQPLALERPPGDAPWQPLEFLVAVDAVGIVRVPVLTESSRVPAVDSYFESYLVNTLRIGERLSPGFYRISIGP